MNNLIFMMSVLFSGMVHASLSTSWIDYIEYLCAGKSDFSIIGESKLERCKRENYIDKANENWKNWQRERFFELTCHDARNKMECYKKNRKNSNLFHNWNLFYEYAYDKNVYDNNLIPQYFYRNNNKEFVTGEEIKSIPLLYLQKLSRLVEDQLESRSEIDFICDLRPENCINTYNNFLNLTDYEFSLLREENIRAIFIGAQHYKENIDNIIRFGTTLSQEDALKFLGIEFTDHRINQLQEITKNYKKNFKSPRLYELSKDFKIVRNCKEKDFSNLYTKFFENGLSISILFGYEDTHLVGEKEYTRFSLYPQLKVQENVEDELLFQGFKKMKKNENHSVYSKNIIYDGKPNKITVRIFQSGTVCPNENKFARSSSILLSRDKNWIPCEEQQESSKIAYNEFVNSLNTDDVIIYKGHSRNGKGPDFDSIYNDTNTFFMNPQNLMDKVGSRKEPGIFLSQSCSSYNHYQPDIKSYSKRNKEGALSFFGTREIDYFTNTESIRVFVKSILNQECPDKINNAFEGSKKKPVKTDYWVPE